MAITGDSILTRAELRDVAKQIAAELGGKGCPDVRTVARMMRGDTPTSDQLVAISGWLVRHGYRFECAASAEAKFLWKCRQKDWRARIRRAKAFGKQVSS